MGNLCLGYPDVIKKFSNPIDLQQDLVNAIRLIEEATSIKTSPTKTLLKFLFPDKITREPLMILDAKQEILLINDNTFRRINGLENDENNYLGGYHNKSGRIFLVENCWCYSNLIHEVLHSRSIFSKSQPNEELKFVYEGLTEFLVGIVLTRNELKCFELWKNLETCFLKDYLKYVKPWYYLSKRTDLSDIIKLYFDTKEPNPYEKLCNALNSITKGNFDIFSDVTRMGIFQDFKEKMSEVYPKDFAAFQGSVIDEINLEHIKRFSLFSV